MILSNQLRGSNHLGPTYSLQTSKGKSDDMHISTQETSSAEEKRAISGDRLTNLQNLLGATAAEK